MLELISKVFAEHFNFGIEPKHFSGKSTRKGGCQNMAVAGLPDSDAARLARYSSSTTTFKHYVKDIGTFQNVVANSDVDRVTGDKLCTSSKQSGQSRGGGIQCRGAMRAVVGRGWRSAVVWGVVCSALRCGWGRALHKDL